MKKTTTVSALLISLVSQVSAAGKEWKAIDLLRGRVSVNMPEGAKIEARGHSVMGAPASETAEARVVYQDGKKKLVVMVWEMFQTAGKVYDEEAKKSLGVWGKRGEETEFEIANVGENLIVGTAKEPNTEDEAILYAAAFHRAKDDSIQRIGIYFNPEFHKNPERCRELMREILDGVRQGDRPLGVAAGIKKFDTFAPPELHVDFPEGFVFTTQVGTDFVVHHIKEVVEFGSDARTLGIYFGGHPGFMHRRIDEEKLEKEEVASKLFGEDHKFIRYGVKGQDGGGVNMETIAAIPGSGGSWMTHIFFSAKDDKGAAELLDILKTGKLVAREKEGEEEKEGK